MRVLCIIWSISMGLCGCARLNPAFGDEQSGDSDGGTGGPVSSSTSAPASATSDSTATTSSSTSTSTITSTHDVTTEASESEESDGTTDTSASTETSSDPTGVGDGSVVLLWISTQAFDIEAQDPDDACVVDAPMLSNTSCAQSPRALVGDDDVTLPEHLAAIEMSSAFQREVHGLYSIDDLTPIALAPTAMLEGLLLPLSSANVGLGVEEFWTGTPNNCGNWTSAQNTDSGTVGSSDATDATWMNVNGAAPCNEGLRVLCYCPSLANHFG